MTISRSLIIIPVILTSVGLSVTAIALYDYWPIEIQRQLLTIPCLHRCWHIGIQRFHFTIGGLLDFTIHFKVRWHIIRSTIFTVHVYVCWHIGFADAVFTVVDLSESSDPFSRSIVYLPESGGPVKR